MKTHLLKGLATAFALACGTMFVASPASANVTLCNSTGYALQFAYRTAIGPRNDLHYNTDGWYYLSNGTCKRIFTGDASIAYHDIAAWVLTSPPHAFLANNQPTSYHCVPSSGRAFNYDGDPDSCPNGWFAFPFVRFDASTYDATFTLY